MMKRSFILGTTTGEPPTIRSAVKKKETRSSWLRPSKIFSNLSVTDLKKNLILYAGSLGFERVGVTRAQTLVKEEIHLKRWIAEGRAGQMGYMEHEPERRARPGELLSGGKSVIALAMSYSASPQPSPLGRGRRSPGEAQFTEGRIARYTHGPDY